MTDDNKEFIPWPYLDTFFHYDKFIENPIATLPKEKHGTEIAIIGAGAAGLMAARLLLQCGFKPVIYEASNRIGGRLNSKRFTNEDGSKSEAFAELGAMRIPESSKVFFKLAEEFKLDTNILFPDPGLVDTQIYYQNKLYDWKQEDDTPGIFHNIQKNWNAFIQPLVDKIMEPWEKGDLEEVQRIWQNYIHHYKGTSFYEAIRNSSPIWTDKELNRFGTLGIGTGGFGSIYPIGFLDMLRVILHKCEHNQKLIVSGVESFSEHLLNTKIETPFGKNCVGKEAVNLNCKIKNIEALDNKHTKLTYTNEKGEDISKEYPAVIVATNTRSMQFMGLSLNSNNEPLVNGNVQAALRRIHVINSSKLFIRTKTKFWKDKSLNIPENIQTDELPRGIYFLDYPQTENGVVCMSYTWGDDSSKVCGIDPKERLELFKSVIEKINPNISKFLVPMNDEIINIDWQTEANYNGAFKLNLPGQENDVSSLYYQYLDVNNKEKDKGIYLAGDSVSWFGGWIEGALHTAINAATAVAKRCGADIPENSPLEIDPNRYTYK